MMIALAAMSICAAAFAAPVMDDDDVIAPKKVEKAFRNMYPEASKAEWELKRDVYVAEFKMDGKEVEAWFRADGTWMRSKTDISAKEVPEIVKKAVKDAYPGWKADDFEIVRDDRDNEFYSVEIEKEGEKDQRIMVTPGGKIVQMPGRNGQGRPGMKPGEGMRGGPGMRQGGPEMKQGRNAEAWKQIERAGGNIEKK